MSIKTIQPFSLNKIGHRVLMIKSAAFIKIVLAKDETTSESSIEDKGYQNLTNFARILMRLCNSWNGQSKIDGFKKIEEAGWKLIPEVQESEEEDSRRASILTNHEPLLDNKPNILNQQQSQENSLFNKEDFSGQNLENASASKSECCRGLARLETYETLRSNGSRTIKMKKRRIIMNKMAKLQALISYLSEVNRKELSMLCYHMQL